MEPSYKIFLLVVFFVIRHPVLSAEVLRNVALGSPVTLSTTLTGYSQTNPSSAVDGKIAQNINTCGCCVSSRNEPNPWLTVDLQKQYMVQKVVVIGRSDYQKEYISRNLQHLQMFNGNHTSTVQIGLQIEMDKNTATARNLDQPFIRRITLKRPKPVNASNKWFLTVCEIEIYVIECPSRTYENNGVCKACGHCSGGRPCDGMTGQCPEGCDSGYIGGTCTQECTNGTYGDCKQRCGQCKAVTCDKVNGRCPTGCNLGYMGDKCDQDCAIGYFGNCSQSCGNCTDGQLCDNVDGSCPGGCSQGYKGDTCHEECLAGTYGQNCSQFCGHCFENGTCHHTNGTCILGCLGGFVGDLCQARDDTSTSQQEIHAFTAPPQPDYYIFDSVEDNPNTVYNRDLWGYIMTCKANQCKLFFEQFKTLPTKLQFEHVTAHLPENIRKNRYREVVTYDHSRVVLQVTSADQTDYINASFVDGYEREKKFIASQGPTPVMINDFWRMIWQQNTTKIVMLTNLVEMGKDKCERYWPETEGVEVEYGEVRVRLEKQDIRLDFCVRTLTVQQSQSAARHVTQYHFNSWPDKNVPDSAWCLVNFWRTVTEQQDGNQPIVVHCSAGVGRTGTCIALDALYEEARAEGGIRPLEMLETLRQHRVKLVQTKEQYVFLHEALAEALLLGPHPYWPRELPEVLSYLQRSDHGASKTRLQVQYQSLCLTVEGLEKTSEPEYGNVKTSEISEDADHSPMTTKPLVEDLKLTNFNGSLAYIVTLTPNEKSLANFWTKIQQYGVKTIINVSGNPGRTSNLGADGKVKLKKYNVNLLHEKAQRCFTVRTYTFKEVDRDDNALSAVKQFEITAWRTGKWIPDDGQLLPMLVDEIIQWQPKITEFQPLFITCSMDWTKCGLLVAVLNEAFRMRYRDCRVNILDTVIGLKRTEGRFISYEQFEYLYDAVISCIKSSVKAEASDVYSNI